MFSSSPLPPSADVQFFFRHPLLADYDYYWRIEPSIKLFCDIGKLPLASKSHELISAYDPFLIMQDEKKVYGFTLSLYEYIETIPTLWDAVKGQSTLSYMDVDQWLTIRIHSSPPRTPSRG